MTKLTYKTKGDSSPQGKERVFFTCHQKDMEPYFDAVCGEIFKTQNCVIWYDCDPGNSWTAEDLELELSRMQLFVIPVTARFLYEKNSAREILFRFAMEHHIPVLPLMQESGLESDFNRICGDLQFLDKHAAQTDPTALPYEQKLERFLSSVLLGDELVAKVRKAFDAYIFLSYRKKDRKYAQELMRLIHQNEFCRDIAIWYDEFLVPGEDFNHSIRDAMEKSELFTFVVTPNLLEQDNYVMTVEYPVAKETGKPILPAEMVPTDRAKLRKDYKEIPDPADAHNGPVLSDALLKGLRDLAIAENDDDPAHLFFIGLAYLNGIDVEENRERGAQLIETAAKADLPEAMEKLSQMYESGDGVERDYEMSAQWLEKLADDRERQFKKSGSGEAGKELFIALWNAGDARIRLGQLERAGESYKKMEAVAQKIAPKSDKYLNQWFLSVCCNRMGDLCLELGDVAKAGEYFEKAARASETIARETGLVKDNQPFSVDCERLGDFYMAQGNLKKARIWNEKRVAVAEKMAREIGTPQYRREVPTSYARMGLLCRDEGKPEQAMDWFRKSMKLYEQIAEETGSAEAYQSLSLSYVQAGGISEAQGKLTEAKAWYRKAIEKQEILAERLCTVESRRNLYISYERLADVYRAEGNLQEARRQYERNLTLSTALAEETGTFNARTDLSYSYDRMGKLCQAEGKMQEAKDWYEKTIKLREQLVRESGSVKSRQLLGTVYQNMGNTFLLQRDLSAARSWYEKGRELLEVLVQETGTVNARTDLTTCYNSLGYVLNEEGKIDEARALFEKMVTLSRQLVEETGTRQARLSLARAYDRMGNLCFNNKDSDGARKWFPEGMWEWERLAAEAETTDVLDGLATSCLWNAIVLSEKLDLPLLKKAEDIWDRLVRQCPNVPSYSNNLNNVRNAIQAEEETRRKNSLSVRFLQAMERLPAKWNQTENKHLINTERRNSQKGVRISVDLYYEVKKHFLKKTTAEYVLDISCTYKDGYVVQKHLLRAESLDKIRAYMSQEGIDEKLEEYIRRP